MSAGLIGAFLGLGAALASAGFLHALAGRVDLPETRRALHVSAVVQIVLLPVVGWFAGPLIAGE